MGPDELEAAVDGDDLAGDVACSRLDLDALAVFLADAGMNVAEQFGDWDRSPLTDASPEIITVARRR